MEKNLRKPREHTREHPREHPREHLSAILIALFAFAFVAAAGAALVTAIKWEPVLSTAHMTPNGTPGSAQPGTIGLARPHPTMPPR
jgi:hypothetical protein